MQIVKTKNELKKIIKIWKNQGQKIALVPTMGFLHEGHLNLIKAAREFDFNESENSNAKNDKNSKKIIVSIFVNPMQFGPNEDLSTYPRDLQKDAALCDEARVDLIFAPEPNEIYASDFASFVDMNALTNTLCGARRNGHFRGVCTILTKLFHLSKADAAFFGQKDAQQCAVIKKMVEDLEFDIKVQLCPIVREKDGLAKSSRNIYLNETERKAALVLSQAIFAGENLIKNGEKNTEKIIAKMREIIENEPLAKIDYVNLVDLKTLKDLKEIQGEVLGAIAVFIGKTRLIDNFIIKV